MACGRNDWAEPHGGAIRITGAELRVSTHGQVPGTKLHGGHLPWPEGEGLEPGRKLWLQEGLSSPVPKLCPPRLSSRKEA